MAAPLTAISKELSELLAEFMASMEDEHSTLSGADANYDGHAVSTSTARQQQPDSSARAEAYGAAGSTDNALEELRGRTAATATAAAQHAAVVSHLIDMIESLMRRCLVSEQELQHMGAALQSLETGATEVQGQLALSAENQHAAAEQASNLLNINQKLLIAVEDLAQEASDEQTARRDLEQIVDDLQQQVSLQQKTLKVLQGYVTSNFYEIQQLQITRGEHCSALTGLMNGKQHLRKQLQKVLRHEQQLGTDLKDTQQAVANEVTSLRRHIRLAGSRTLQASRAFNDALSDRVTHVQGRLDVLAGQLLQRGASAQPGRKQVQTAHDCITHGPARARRRPLAAPTSQQQQLQRPEQLQRQCAKVALKQQKRDLQAQQLCDHQAQGLAESLLSSATSADDVHASGDSYIGAEASKTGQHGLGDTVWPGQLQQQLGQQQIGKGKGCRSKPPSNSRQSSEQANASIHHKLKPKKHSSYSSKHHHINGGKGHHDLYIQESKQQGVEGLSRAAMLLQAQLLGQPLPAAWIP